MQTLYYNGIVYVNSGHFEQAFIVEDGKFTFVGSNEAAFSKVSSDVLKIDLKNRTIVPGFNDSHLHFYYTGKFLKDVNLSQARSIKDVINLGKDFLKKFPNLSMLTGHGWNQDYFTDDDRLLTRYDLDQISTTIPIIFTRACGHVATANTLALKLASITIDSVVEGGDVGKQSGELTGVLSENAIDLLKGLTKDDSIEEIIHTLHHVSKIANSYGITSVQTNDLKIGAIESDLIEQAYQKYSFDQPSVRIYHQSCFTDLNSFKGRINEGYDRSTNDFLRYGPLKLFTDGSLGARTAYLSQSYHDDTSTKGIPTLTQDEINAYVKVAHENNIQVAMHAIGDAAMDRVLKSYESLKYKENTLRHGIIHCQITDKKILERCKELDVVAYLQPIFLHYDLHIVEERVGKELASTSYAFKSFDDLNVHVAYGTDSPVEPFHVMNCLHCAVNRTDLNHYPEGGFYPEERISIQQAIDHYTIGSAYASFEEDRKGRIFPGFFADFVVLSDNIFTIDSHKIKDIEVLATIVDGRIVYQKTSTDSKLK